MYNEAAFQTENNLMLAGALLKRFLSHLLLLLFIFSFHSLSLSRFSICCPGSLEALWAMLYLNIYQNNFEWHVASILTKPGYPQVQGDKCIQICSGEAFVNCNAAFLSDPVKRFRMCSSKYIIQLEDNYWKHVRKNVKGVVLNCLDIAINCFSPFQFSCFFWWVGGVGEAKTAPRYAHLGVRYELALHHYIRTWTSLFAADAVAVSELAS